MQKILILALICVLFQPVQARGVLDALNQYADAVENRTVYQRFLTTQPDQDAGLSELLAKEDAARREIENLLSDDDDIRSIALGYICDSMEVSRAVYFKDIFRDKAFSRLNSRLDKRIARGTEKAADCNLSNAKISAWIVSDVALLDQPDLTGTAAAVIGKDTAVSIISSSNNWFLVQDQDGLQGYVHSMFLRFEPVALTAKSFLEPKSLDLSSPVQGRVITHGANFRLGPGMNFEIICTLDYFTGITIISGQGDWLQAKIADGRTGYIHKDLVRISSSGLNAGATHKGFITTPSGANVRTGPGTSYSKITALPNGTGVTVIGESGKWFNLIIPDGRKGYIHVNLVTLDYTPTVPVNDDNPVAPDEIDIPPDLSAFTRIDDQKPTYYFTEREEGFPTSGSLYGNNYNGSERKDILTPEGKKIATTSGRFFAALCMEGSGIIKDGRTCSFVSNKRFQVAPQGCLGITCTGYWVVPFHTLAVNRNEMPYKGVYFIPESRGLKLPNGQTHDGYWFAHDTGGADDFNGTPKHRCDMYADKTEYWKWMEANFKPSFSPFKAYRVDDETKNKVYDKYKNQLGK
ncbi:MAG: SH3 domain-containing protein [Candidatus Wallbacteria bacterium]|nr:SH3 domain-containing protein [Candidatus Wallbacteria bacterium]